MTELNVSIIYCYRRRDNKNNNKIKINKILEIRFPHLSEEFFKRFFEIFA